MLTYKINNNITFQTKDVSNFEVVILMSNYSKDVNRTIDKLLNRVDNTCYEIISEYNIAFSCKSANKNLETMQYIVRLANEKIESINSLKDNLESYNEMIFESCGKRIDLRNIISTIDKMVNEIDNFRVISQNNINERFSFLS